jgi:aspartate kinase
MNSTEFRVTLEKESVKFTLIGVPDKPGTAASIFSRLSAAGINVQLVVQTAGKGSLADISLAVQEKDVKATEEHLQTLQDELGVTEITRDDQVALISLEKEDLSKVPGCAARMFRTLANRNINIDLISTSLCSITCLIDAAEADGAHQAVCVEFSFPT